MANLDAGHIGDGIERPGVPSNAMPSARPLGGLSALSAPAGVTLAITATTRNPAQMRMTPPPSKLPGSSTEGVR